MKHSPIFYERDNMLRDINPNVEATFNWAQWTPNTSLKLCNVPWDSSYRDLARFETPQEQQEWFDRQPGVDRVHGVMHMFGQPVRVELPFNEASNYNYVVVYNDYPDLESPRYWYYFINTWITSMHTLLSSPCSWTFGSHSSMCLGLDHAMWCEATSASPMKTR